MKKKAIQKRAKAGAPQTKAEVAGRIERLIRERNCATGEKLMGFRQLATLTGSTVPTVEKAIQLLAARGVVRVYPKSGTFVGKLESETVGPFREEMAPWRPNDHVPRLRLLIQNQDDSTRASWDPVLRAIAEQQPPYEVEVRCRPLPIGAALDGEKDFDLALLGQWKFNECHGGDHFLPLDSELARPGAVPDLSGIPPLLLEMGKLEGRLRAVPVVASVVLLYINRDRFALRHRIDGPDDFVRIFGEARRAGLSGPLINAIRPDLLLNAYGTNGRAVPSDGRNGFSLNPDCLRKALSAFRRLYEDRVFLEEGTDLDQWEAFLHGRIPMFVLPSGILGAICRRAGFDLEVVPLPGHDGRFLGGVNVLAINRGTAQVERSLDLLRRLVSPEIQTVIARGRSDLPSRVSAIAAIPRTERERRIYADMERALERAASPLPEAQGIRYYAFVNQVLYQEAALMVLGRQSEEETVAHLLREQVNYQPPVRSSPNRNQEVSA